MMGIRNMDIVADVLRKADPAELQAATLRLGRKGDATVKGTQSARAQTDASFSRSVHLAKDQARLSGHVVKQADTGMRGLENVLASKMVEAMLPEDQKSIYGDGTAGEVWRGFQIEMMGKALASQGLLSLASRTSAAHGHDLPNSSQFKIRPFAGQDAG
jgi:peptidoglycan hydrolase FlgJ